MLCCPHLQLSPRTAATPCPHLCPEGSPAQFWSQRADVWLLYSWSLGLLTTVALSKHHVEGQRRMTPAGYLPPFFPFSGAVGVNTLPSLRRLPQLRSGLLGPSLRVGRTHLPNPVTSNHPTYLLTGLPTDTTCLSAEGPALTPQHTLHQPVHQRSSVQDRLGPGLALPAPPWSL